MTRREALKELERLTIDYGKRTEEEIERLDEAVDMAMAALKAEPQEQPERPFEIQDILDYLDTVLHPIISPEHWNVYSELHDMISTLPSAQSQGIIRCKDCKHWRDSDGVYRRGTDAESKCPLNTQEVYAGTFYCGYAERRQRDTSD